ncbi:hypothetical protein [Tsuneonella amylolytica]|uniref:hypothetical protein n=1 Tax=Tsuneonella amylolytica TaxID=2338327 RepID=UPI000EA8E36F|nr:hypothetical protein [Tsuneonella amylolytica]
MKKLAFLATSALVGQTLIAAPAMAALPIPNTTTFDAMQVACDAAKPRNTNGVIYTTEPYVAAAVTSTIETARTTIESIPGGILISQTPFEFTTGSEHRNGYSTNVHGNFTSTAVYSGGKLVQEVTETTNTQFTFGCNVLKTTNGVTDLAPPGQQVDPTLIKNEVGTTTTRTETVSAPDVTVTLNDEKVICISPKKNPGTWTSQNGYAGMCDTALYLRVAQGGPVPSNSVPGVSQLLPNAPDHQTGLPEDQLYYPQLPNDPSDFDEI